MALLDDFFRDWDEITGAPLLRYSLTKGENPMIDLDAIGQRLVVLQNSVRTGGFKNDIPLLESTADIEALLGEVHRMRHVMRECECRSPEWTTNGLVGTFCPYAAKQDYGVVEVDLRGSTNALDVGKHTGPALAAKIRKLNGGKGEK